MTARGVRARRLRGRGGRRTRGRGRPPGARRRGRRGRRRGRMTRWRRRRARGPGRGSGRRGTGHRVAPLVERPPLETTWNDAAGGGALAADRPRAAVRGLRVTPVGVRRRCVDALFVVVVRQGRGRAGPAVDPADERQPVPLSALDRDARRLQGLQAGRAAADRGAPDRQAAAERPEVDHHGHSRGTRAVAVVCRGGARGRSGSGIRQARRRGRERHSGGRTQDAAGGGHEWCVLSRRGVHARHEIARDCSPRQSVPMTGGAGIPAHDLSRSRLRVSAGVTPASPARTWTLA